MEMAIDGRCDIILIEFQSQKKKAHITDVKNHTMANGQVPTAKKIQDIMSF